MKLFAAALLSAGLMAASSDPNRSTQAGDERLAGKVRHEILMLPYYGVFDAINFEVNGDVVKLTGAVTRPTLKSDIGRIVARLEGVRLVENRIEVLPLSRFDDQIRLAVARAIYGYPALQRYGMPVNAPIRIIVENGRVDLRGVVDNETDSNIAFIRANGVSGVFAVENHLQVASRKG
jgi:hyperosmotically inducible protein